MVLDICEGAMTKIYFAGSIRAGREDVAVYEAMIESLRSLGEVLTEHVGDPGLSSAGEDGPDDRSIHDRDMRALFACDVVVAEVSRPSLGVGYELGRAIAIGKPVLCLYRATSERTLSAMIGGSPGIQTARYSDTDEARQIMAAFIGDVTKTHVTPGDQCDR